MEKESLVFFVNPLTLPQRQLLYSQSTGGSLWNTPSRRWPIWPASRPRTLRWYDRIGLLKPLRTTEAGYRLYGPAQLDRLQDILFYRELGLDLASIRTILDDPAFDRQAALQSHLAELEARRARLDDLILTVQRTINDIKGGTKMTDQEKFEAFKRRTVEANETALRAGDPGEIRR